MVKYIKSLVLGLGLFTSSLYSQSINLDSFQEVQLLNVQNCAVVQVNASWNYANRVDIQELSKLCYIAEVDIENKNIGAVIVKEWEISVVPTIIVLRNGEEVKRFEPGISMKFKQEDILESIRKEVQ